MVLAALNNVNDLKETVAAFQWIFPWDSTPLNKVEITLWTDLLRVPPKCKLCIDLQLYLQLGKAKRGNGGTSLLLLADCIQLVPLLAWCPFLEGVIPLSPTWIPLWGSSCQNGQIPGFPFLSWSPANQHLATTGKTVLPFGLPWSLGIRVISCLPPTLESLPSSIVCPTIGEIYGTQR